MNTPTGTAAAPSRPHATAKFKWLLKREYWENRGGFFWAPLITGIIFLVMTFVGLAIATTVHLNSGGSDGLDISDLDGHAQTMGYAGDVSLLIGIGLALTVLAFVVFFYSLGSLYDDRRDRSMLFWKSLPISDSQMVLSKAAWALLLAPLVAIGVGIVIGLVLWVLTSIAATVNSFPSAWAVFTHSHPLRMLLNVLAIVPVYAMWALPSVGWLMFCSAWARRFPFLWAVLVPFLLCAMVSMVSLIAGAATNSSFPHGMLWYVVMYRGLFSVHPVTVYALPQVREGASGVSLNNADDFARVIDLSQTWHAFATADLWIGAVIGMAFIAAAIRLRRWRDEA